MMPTIILWSIFGIVLFFGILLKYKNILEGDMTTKKSLTMCFLALISGPIIWSYIVLFNFYKLIEKIVGYGFKDDK
jgi:hypothetical protein